MGITPAQIIERPWNIAEQVIEDPTTKLRLEFSSVHTEEVAEGKPAPDHDQILFLRLWTSDRLRVATYAFTRGGAFIKATVEPLGGLAGGDEPSLRPTDAHGNVLESELTEQERAMMAKAQAQQMHDAGQLVDPVRDFEDINYAKQFEGDI